jgi:hypothetical protein
MLRPGALEEVRVAEAVEAGVVGVVAVVVGVVAVVVVVADVVVVVADVVVVVVVVVSQPTFCLPSVTASPPGRERHVDHSRHNPRQGCTLANSIQVHHPDTHHQRQTILLHNCRKYTYSRTRHLAARGGNR